MYDDPADGALVFYTYPCVHTANTRFSRTELREQIEPGSNSTNWTFGQGGLLRGTCKVEDISKDAGGKFHSTIVMQIHGRLTDDQRARLAKPDNDAPPIVKVYWNNGKIRVKTKVLKDLDAGPERILHKDA